MGGRMAGLNLDGVSSNMQVAELLKILRANREKHVATFGRAVEGWKKKVRAEIEKVRAKLDSEALNADVFIHLSKPTSYLDAYDTVIEMLERTHDTEIRLDSTAFRQLVQDQWTWTESFDASSKVYLGG